MAADNLQDFDIDKAIQSDIDHAVAMGLLDHPNYPKDRFIMKFDIIWEGRPIQVVAFNGYANIHLYGVFNIIFGPEIAKTYYFRIFRANGEFNSFCKFCRTFFKVDIIDDLSTKAEKLILKAFYTQKRYLDIDRLCGLYFSQGETVRSIVSIFDQLDSYIGYICEVGIGDFDGYTKKELQKLLGVATSLIQTETQSFIDATAARLNQMPPQ